MLRRLLVAIAIVPCQTIESKSLALAETPTAALRATANTDSGIELPRRGICAHRGASATHPENTLASLEEAVRLGAHMLEFDVALTKDGHVVLMHDSTVDRTTTGSGPLSDFTLAELRSFDAGSWKGERFSGEKVPTLVAVLATMPSNIWLNVHLKGSDVLAEKTTRQLSDADRLHQSLLACGHEAAAAAQSITPNIQICNMDRQATPELYAETTLRRQAKFIQLLARRKDNLRQLPLLRKHHVRINWCCTNDSKQLCELFAAGVEFVLVDKVAQMLDAAGDLGIERHRPIYRVK